MFFSRKNLWLKISFLAVIFLIFWGLSHKDGRAIPFGQAPVFFILKKPAVFLSSVGGWFREQAVFLGSIGELKEKNSQLFEENLSLKARLSELTEAEQENQTLRRELDLRKREKLNSQAALIAVRRLENGQAALFIDKGTESGIKEGAAVLANQKFLIGKIKKTFWGGSEVELIFDANFLVGVEAQEKSTPGVLQGVRGTSVVLDKVPRAEDMESGQTLITSGLGGEFPRGLLVGYVGQELESEGGLFRRFSVELPLEIEKIRLVWVLNK